jgi:hypothetical protein
LSPTGYAGATQRAFWQEKPHQETEAGARRRRNRKVVTNMSKAISAQEGGATNLLVAMTGKASAAKAAEGDKPVFDYIASLPQPQRAIAERVDALAAKAIPDLKRAVKWGMVYYGVSEGWSFYSGAFVGHQKVMFIRGTELEPEPPVTPTGIGKSTRGVEPASVDELDEAQLLDWMTQAAAKPFVGASKRR